MSARIERTLSQNGSDQEFPFAKFSATDALFYDKWMLLDGKLYNIPMHLLQQV